MKKGDLASSHPVLPEDSFPSLKDTPEKIEARRLDDNRDQVKSVYEGQGNDSYADGRRDRKRNMFLDARTTLPLAFIWPDVIGWNRCTLNDLVSMKTSSTRELTAKKAASSRALK